VYLFEESGRDKVAIMLDNLKKLVQMQKKSDRQMSKAWLLIFFLPGFIVIVAFGYFLGYFLTQFSSLDSLVSYDYVYTDIASQVALPWFVYGLSWLTTLTVSLVVTYLLVNRRSTHCKRQKLLSEQLITTIDSIAKTKDADVSDSLLSLEKNVKDANADKTEKNPILSAVLSAFIPFMSLYVYYFLMTDFYKHEQFENNFWEETSNTLNKLGINFSVPHRTEPIPNRSFIMYLILTIVSTGLFGAYWIYVLLKDPNEHFKYHPQLESQLLTALESVAN